MCEFSKNRFKIRNQDVLGQVPNFIPSGAFFNFGTKNTETGIKFSKKGVRFMHALTLFMQAPSDLCPLSESVFCFHYIN